MAPHGHPHRRADPDRALAVDQRPQPRRRLPAPARALLPRRWEAVRDAPVGGGRGGDPPGRDLEGQVGAHPGDPARDPGPEGPARASSTGCARAPIEQAARTTCGAARASGARPPPACCCSPTGCATCRSTRTSRASARAWGCCAPGAPVRGAARPDARPDPAGRGARAARQPAPPRPAHLPRPSPGLRAVRAGADVPEPRAVPRAAGSARPRPQPWGSTAKAITA